jgi:hypothetical protein
MNRVYQGKTLTFCCLIGALLMTVPYAEASSKSDKDKDKDKGKKVKIEVKYDLETGLLQCSDVNVPALLSGCGTDPLIGGKVSIEKDGSVEVHVAGALPSATYDVVYVSLDGSHDPVGQITTDSVGNAKQKWLNAFTLGEAGSGNLVLQRSGSTQFVSGFAVIK